MPVLFSTLTVVTSDPFDVTLPSSAITIVIGEANLLYPFGASVSVR